MIDKRKVEDTDCVELLKFCKKFTETINWPEKAQIEDATILMRAAIQCVSTRPDMEDAFYMVIEKLRKLILYGKLNGIEVPDDIIAWKPG